MSSVLLRRVGALALVAALTGFAPAAAFEPGRTGPVERSATDLTVVEYNILGANHHRGERIGGPLVGRTRRAGLILATGDLAVTQEDMLRQQRLLHADLPDHASVPRRPSRVVSNVVYYRRSRFDLVNAGYFRYPGDRDPGRRRSQVGTVVRLRDLVTGTFYLVVDAHLPSHNDAPGGDRGGSRKRRVAARTMHRLVHRDLAAHPADVAIVAADTNSKKWLVLHQTARTPRSNDLALHGHRAGLPDCVLTADTDELANAYDLARNRHGTCPRAQHSAQTDEVLWVYLTPQPGMRYHAHRLFGRRQATISDHPPVMVRVETRGG